MADVKSTKDEAPKSEGPKSPAPAPVAAPAQGKPLTKDSLVGKRVYPKIKVLHDPLTGVTYPVDGKKVTDETTSGWLLAQVLAGKAYVE